MNQKLVQIITLLVLANMLINCGSHHNHKHSHDHGKTSDKKETHAHIAPNGGVLVELGEEFAHLELVVDPVNNKVICYVFDGALKFGLKANQATIEAEIKDSEVNKTILFKAVANVLASNTENESSQYEADLKMESKSKISLIIKKITVNNRSFENITTPLIGQ